MIKLETYFSRGSIFRILCHFYWYVAKLWNNYIIWFFLKNNSTFSDVRKDFTIIWKLRELGWPYQASNSLKINTFLMPLWMSQNHRSGWIQIWRYRQKSTLCFWRKKTNRNIYKKTIFFIMNYLVSLTELYYSAHILKPWK